MKNLTYAKEVILESRRLRNLYKESGRDFHKIKSHMYSIFECYANNLIEWNDVKILWKESIKKYLNLYENDSKLYKIESARMRKEYRETLDCKPLLDEYRTYIAEKNVKKIVEKISVTESQAVDVLLNRTLSIRSLKEISQISSWEKVMESFPMLRKQDEERIRMLTIFENDMFNVTGWSKLNEGPTLDTTQMITTVMSEAPRPTMNPNTIRNDLLATPTSMPSRVPAMVGSIAGGQVGRIAGRAIAGPIGGLVGKSIGSQIGSQMGTNIAMNRVNAANPSVAAPTLSTSGSISNSAPTTSLRPKPRPMATEDAPKTSIRPVARPGRSLPGGGYQWPNGAVEPGAGATFMTDMPTPKARPANLTKSNTPAAGSNLAPTTSIRPQRRPASNVGRREMSPTPGVWDGSTRGFESVQQEGYKTIKSIDKERYDEIPGLEGPFMTLSGKVVYYDPKEGSYYDRDTDMYLSYEEFKELDNDYSGMKNTREIKEAEEGTYMKQWYDYSEDFAMLELYVDGKLVDQWNDYFGANVTGNPLQQKFIDMAKKNGVDPIGLKVIDGENGNEGVFTSRGLKWNSNEAKAKPGHNARAMARAQDIIRKGIEQSQKKNKSLDEANTSYENEEPVVFNGKKFTSYKRFSSREKANAFLEKNEAYGMLGTKDGYVYVAKNANLGESKVNEAKATLGGAVNRAEKSRQSAISKAKAWMKRTGKSAEDAAREFDLFKSDISKLKEEVELDEANTSYEKDMDHDKAVVIRGVKGVKSTPFRKKFKNMAAYDKWSDSEEASNYEVHDVMNESVLSESDIVNFSSFAGMYSDGAHAYFKGKDGKVHKVSATGDRPRKFYINGQETPWDEVKRVVGNQHIQPMQGMMHESNVNEAVTLDYSRHLRSHGKKPRDPGYSALWMFTTREYDMPDDDEIFKFQGSFADAKKAAAKWAKTQGAYRVYVME